MKPSTAKQKGAKTEQLFVDYIKTKGIPAAERRHLSGAKDMGDVAGWCRADHSHKVCVEIKSGASLNIQQWLRELALEIFNSKSDTGFVAVRPKGKPNPKDWFAVMPLDGLIELLGEAGYIPDL